MGRFVAVSARRSGRAASGGPASCGQRSASVNHHHQFIAPSSLRRGMQCKRVKRSMHPNSEVVQLTISVHAANDAERLGRHHISTKNSIPSTKNSIPPSVREVFFFFFFTTDIASAAL
jgi:hypothetical protein